VKSTRKRYSLDCNAKVALEAIPAARAAAGGTQTAVGLPDYSSLSAWQQWEAGLRRMHPGPADLFNIKATDMRGKERTT
jgi:hypothetical protein